MLPGVALTRTRIMIWTAAAVVLSMLAFSAIASTASAQSQPPVCAEYPDLPECQEPTGEEGAADDGAPGAGGGPTADSGAGGNLPFTGYPVTGLVFLLVALLLVGLAIRSYLAIRDRIAGESGTTG